MKNLTLYILLTLTVLAAALAGCSGSDDSDNQREVQAVRNADRSERPRAQPAPSDVDDDGRGVILVLGNSLAAGYGVGAEEAFPALLQARIDSLGLPFQVVNAGLSGETTAGGLRRLDWLLRQQPVEMLILELGGNDGLRGIPTETTRANLQAIIENTRARYPHAQIVLAGMQVPPNLGADYTGRFQALYPTLAEENDVHLIPFLLEGVGGVSALNQPDGIHPTAQGHRIVAENVWQTVGPVLLNETLEAEPAS